jgi:hypothetical protein
LNQGTNNLSAYNIWTGNNDFTVPPTVPLPDSDLDSGKVVSVNYLNTRLSSINSLSVSNLSVANISCNSFFLSNDKNDLLSTNCLINSSPTNVYTYYNVKSTEYSFNKSRATVDIGLGRDQLHSNMGTYKVSSGDITNVAGSIHGGTLTNIANSQVMKNNLDTLVKTTTFGTNTITETYNADSNVSTVVHATVDVKRSVAGNTTTNNGNYTITTGTFGVAAGEISHGTSKMSMSHPTSNHRYTELIYNTGVYVKNYFLNIDTSVVSHSTRIERSTDISAYKGLYTLSAGEFKTTAPISPLYSYPITNVDAIGFQINGTITGGSSFSTSVGNVTATIGSITLTTGIWLINFVAQYSNTTATAIANFDFISLRVGTTTNGTDVYLKSYFGGGQLRGSGLKGDAQNLTFSIVYTATTAQTLSFSTRAKSTGVTSININVSGTVDDGPAEIKAVRIA